MNALLEFARRVVSRTKHGPLGSGKDGPCSSDCIKCEAERIANGASSQQAMNAPEIADAIAQLLALAVSDEVRVDVLERVLKDRCRTCFEVGGGWCCYRTPSGGDD